MNKSNISKLNNLWSDLVSGGMNDSFEIVSQLSVLIFLKRLDSIQNLKEANAAFWETEVSDPIFDDIHETCRWSIFSKFSKDKMFNNMKEKVFPFLQFDISLNSDTYYAAYLKNTDFKIPNADLLYDAVYVIGSIDFDDENTTEECFSHLLSKLSPDYNKAQFRTPSVLVDLMTELVKPNIEDTICDPAVGTGSFLVSAAKYIWNNSKSEFTNQDNLDRFSSKVFTGMDFDPDMVNITAMNLNLAKVLNPDITLVDSLSAGNIHSNEYSLILTNPPFSTKTNADHVAESLQSSKTSSNTSVLFFRLLLRMLKSGGRCAAIIPDVILFGVQGANMLIKNDLLNNHRIEAIIPISDSGIEYLGNLSFSIIIFTKDIPEGTSDVWYYNYTSSDCIPDLIYRYNHKEDEYNRSRYDKSFFVSKKEIIENNYMLIFDRYKKSVSNADYSSFDSIQDLEIANSILRNSLNDLDSDI